MHACQAQRPAEPPGKIAEMINQKSLREQVYEFLREELHKGNLAPGASINLTRVSESLGISKTPLRDALIQLEVEGFVTISPRRGVFVNRLGLEDIKHYYEIIGALEAAVLASVFDKVRSEGLDEMKRLNREIVAALDREDYDAYYQLNIQFHHLFVDMSANEPLKQIILPMKQRLYDFPQRGYMKNWEEQNCRDHEALIEAVERGDKDAAAAIWRDRHWSFSVQEPYIKKFYLFEEG